MSSAEFRPGPWMSQFDEDHHAWIVRIPSDGAVIAGVIESGFETQDEANANLIASAPELYEALEAIQPLLPAVWVYNEEAQPFLKKIAAALARARGEPS